MENNFKEVCERLSELLYHKNNCYDNSYDKTVDEYGKTIMALRIQDKLNRVKSKNNNNFESLIDTYMDIAGYAILAVLYLERNEINGK